MNRACLQKSLRTWIQLQSRRKLFAWRRWVFYFHQRFWRAWAWAQNVCPCARSSLGVTRCRVEKMLVQASELCCARICLVPERQDLLSPASSNVTNRLLPRTFLQWKNRSTLTKSLFSVQSTLAMRSWPCPASAYYTGFLWEWHLCTWACPLGPARWYSQLWFESVSGVLKEKRGFEHCAAYPCLLGNQACLILLHVDDMLVLTEQQYFDVKHIQTLTGNYKDSQHEAGRWFVWVPEAHSHFGGWWDDAYIYISAERTSLWQTVWGCRYSNFTVPQEGSMIMKLMTHLLWAMRRLLHTGLLWVCRST